MSKNAASRVWVLLGPHQGDNNQVLALANALGIPFETRTLAYNRLRRLGPRMLGSTLLSVARSSRFQLQPPWPELVIGIGRRSVPVARWIRGRSGGRTKLVRIGNPRVGPALFDLVITTAQYPVEAAENVLRLPLVMSPYRDDPHIEPDERRFLSALPHPRLLMALGGRAKFWRMSGEAVAAAARRLEERASRAGGSLIVVTSPRTEPDVLEEVCGALGRATTRVVDSKRPRFAVLLDAADEIFVTADSVSMISESILTGKPVGCIPIELSRRGRRLLGPRPGDGGHRRDLRMFWNELERRGMIGDVDRPVRSAVAEPVDQAASAVQRLVRKSAA